MRFYKSEFFYPIIGIIASIFFCTIIWDHITLSYSNPHEIIGEYSKNSYNSFNDTLRYIIFISIPVLFFFIICSTAVSRYMVKCHTLLQIVLGIIMGAIMGYISYLIVLIFYILIIYDGQII